MTDERHSSPSRAKRQRAMREAQIERAEVPGFPEIKWALNLNVRSRCRLCELAYSQPNLLREVHALWSAGQGVRRLEETVGKRVSPPLDRQSFARHLRRHTDLQNPNEKERITVSDIKSKLDVLADSEELKGYFDLRDMIERLKARMQEIDESGVMFDEDGTLSLSASTVWLAIVREMRGCIAEFARMKNNDRLVGSIVKDHTRRYARAAGTALQPGLAAVREALASGDLNAARAAFATFQERQVGEAMRAAAETTVRESIDQFKLN